MKKNLSMVLLLSFVFLLGTVCISHSRASELSENAVIADSLNVIHEVMNIPAKGIPASLLHKAEAVAIVPGLVKGGFIVGLERGNGVLVVRSKDNVWEAPRFITMRGAGLGLQAGIQEVDIILVFCTRKSVASVLNGRLRLGLDAALSAGPVGRQASAGTDTRLQSEIYSYSRSRGLFLGLSLDGSSIEILTSETQAFYPEGKVPFNAKHLTDVIARYVERVDMEDPETVRKELVKAYETLRPLLNSQWKTYLALPEDVNKINAIPKVDTLEAIRVKYQKVSVDPQYAELSQKNEFLDVLELLNSYISALEKTQDTNIPATEKLPLQQLPPPPSA